MILGRKERVSFPEWGIPRLRAKIDTGAYSSALDVQSYDLEGDPNQGGTATLHLVVRRKPEKVVLVRAPWLGMRTVTNSGGRQRRPLIEAVVDLGPVRRTIRLTVTNRDRLRCRMLLGRQALAGTFLVDVSRRYLLD